MINLKILLILGLFTSRQLKTMQVGHSIMTSPLAGYILTNLCVHRKRKMSYNQDTVRLQRPVDWSDGLGCTCESQLADLSNRGGDEL